MFFPSHRAGHCEGRRCDPNLKKIPCGQNPLALAGRASLHPDVYAQHNELRGSKLPHEMSYPTAQTLQYGVTLAQESAAVRPHVPRFKSCNLSLFHHTAILRGFGVLTVATGHVVRPVDSRRRAHRIAERAAPKRRHVSFSGRLLLHRANAGIAAGVNLQ